jgi:hypothetical protein
MQIRTVTSVGNSVQTTAKKTAANPAWAATVDIDGSQIQVVLKDETPERLARELLSVALAHLLGVPYIRGWAASLDRDQARAIGLSSNIPHPNDPTRRLVFASELSPGTPIAQSGSMADVQIKTQYYAHVDSVHILVFDELVANCDRQYENLMEEGGRFLAFDHDKVLFGDRVTWSHLPPAAAQASACNVSDDVGIFAPGTKSSAHNLATSWANILTSPAPIMTDLVQIKLLSVADAQAVIDYLIARVPCLPSLVDQRY